MKNLMLMYHFVRDGSELPSFSIEEFRQQLEFVSREYDNVSLKDLVEKKPGGKTFTITFDDAIKDGIVNCSPVLQELGMKAAFFVPTSILLKRKVLHTHKRNLILGRLGAERFGAEINKRVEEIFQITPDAVAANHYDSQMNTSLKYILDRMDQAVSAKILGEIFDELFDEREEFSDMYMTAGELKELRSRGHDLGLHGHTHVRLAELYFRDQERDFDTSVAVFKEKLEENPRWVSYPLSSFNLFTVRLARRAGLDVGLTTRKHYNTDLEKPFELARFDCIDLFPEKEGYP